MTTRLRALPLTPPPVHGETIGSYLNRLADANHLTIGHLSSLVGPSRQHGRVDNRVGYWTPAALSRLAFLTGRSASLLVHAMPPLGAIGDPSLRLPHSVTEEVTEPRLRPACRLCMARRHIRGLVVRSTPPQQGVCHRHRRWLLGDEQYDLTRLPEVLCANRPHQRLVRRGTLPSTDLAYIAAHDRALIGSRPKPAAHLFGSGGTADSTCWVRTRSVIPTAHPTPGSSWSPIPKS
ncbi:TniQ family protein [Streptomyces sp. NPDC051963]|uniref:TniQ family protein n=1 Tax=Streptomyces sp. NPDC051963 TaxID=3365678 RepID=UPI0037D4B1F1